VTHAHAMLDTYARSFEAGADDLASAIDALVDCAATCTQCADACLSEGDRMELARCIGLNHDCADVCATASRVISRQAGYDASVTRALLTACLAACRSCGDECGSHAQHMEHCAICREQCRRCEKACRTLLGSLG